MLLSCGFNRPIAGLLLSDIPQIIKCVSLHSALLVIKAELDEIIKGLDDAGVLKAVQRWPQLFKPLFVHQTVQLKAGML